jgi:serine phosphatase RsbU (regulator of sigma subunit)
MKVLPGSAGLSVFRIVQNENLPELFSRISVPGRKAEAAMSEIFQRLVDSLMERRDGISAWFRQSAPSSRQIRLGVAGEQAIEEQLRNLDTAIEMAKDEDLGVCEICHEHVEDSTLEMDYAARVCLDHLTGDERSRLENDLELSQKVQKALLPHRVPDIPGLDIAAFSQPALIVGGDYFDFLRFKDGSHGLVIADVMGKGMAASMLMASFQASLRIIAPESEHPHEVMSRLNRLFRHNIRLTRFVTVFLARYDEKSRILYYCNAGHNPPLILHANGDIESLNPSGAAIGLVEQATFVTDEVRLSTGDRILAFTDGVVELPNGRKEFFGDERLIQFMRTTGKNNARQIVTSLRGQLQGFSGSQTPADDTTMIALVVREPVERTEGLPVRHNLATS